MFEWFEIICNKVKHNAKDHVNMTFDSSEMYTHTAKIFS